MLSNVHMLSASYWVHLMLWGSLRRMRVLRLRRRARVLLQERRVQLVREGQRAVRRPRCSGRADDARTDGSCSSRGEGWVRAVWDLRDAANMHCLRLLRVRRLRDPHQCGCADLHLVLPGLLLLHYLHARAASVLRTERGLRSARLQPLRRPPRLPVLRVLHQPWLRPRRDVLQLPWLPAVMLPAGMLPWCARLRLRCRVPRCSRRRLLLWQD